MAANNATSVDVGSSHTFNIAEFNFSDGAEGNNLQSVIITRLPTDGTLTLNGQPVTANTAISAADIAAGKLVTRRPPRARTPRSASRSATTAARPTAAGHVGRLQLRHQDQQLHLGRQRRQRHGTNPPINGGSGDDVILGDKGGTVTTVEPGKNYNIALVVDTSGSMKDASGTNNLSRMQLTIDALKNLATTLSKHDGIVNVTLIGFESSASSKYSINGLTRTTSAT